MELLLPATVIVAVPLLAWMAVRGSGWKTEIVVGIIAVAATISGTLATLLERVLERRRLELTALPTPVGLTPELRERWRVRLLESVTKTRVGEGGQLAKMVRHGDPIDVDLAHVDRDSGRPRVRVGGRMRPWSEITRQWNSSAGRLVILGDPGAGKTVAALTLIKHINAQAKTGAGIAELFPLAEWQHWRGAHPDALFSDWLIEQLTLMHPQLPVRVAQDLLDARLILPVLDGLDDIATMEQRRACVAAIDAYGERGEPHRPFVLTCRAREYRELAPDWVRDDECVVLAALRPEQIRQRLHELTIGRRAWNVLRERQVAGDEAINELLASPLRLAIVLQVYRDRDPGELLALPKAQVRARLWERLLETNADDYPGATAAQVRAWLAWLAAGMQRTGRQRFMMHELYLLDPRPAANFAAFGAVNGFVLGLIFGLVLGLAGWLRGGPNGALLGWGCGWMFGLVGGGLVDPAPTVRTKVPWRTRARYAMTRDNLIRGLAMGLIGALIGALIEGLIGALIGALAGGLMAITSVTFDMTTAGSEVIRADPPLRFAHGGPDAVLIATRQSGVSSGCFSGLTGGLVSGLVFGLSGGGLVGGLVFGPAIGVAGGLVVGRYGGLGAWLYHHWLRWRLGAQGLLPTRLSEFLVWCARDERGWLRISDAYEFRHRELIEHLAPAIADAHADGGALDVDEPTHQHVGGEEKF